MESVYYLRLTVTNCYLLVCVLVNTLYCSRVIMHYFLRASCPFFLLFHFLPESYFFYRKCKVHKSMRITNFTVSALGFITFVPHAAIKHHPSVYRYGPLHAKERTSSHVTFGSYNITAIILIPIHMKYAKRLACLEPHLFK